MLDISRRPGQTKRPRRPLIWQTTPMPTKSEPPYSHRHMTETLGYAGGSINISVILQVQIRRRLWVRRLGQQQLRRRGPRRWSRRGRRVRRRIRSRMARGLRRGRHRRWRLLLWWRWIRKPGKGLWSFWLMCSDNRCLPDAHGSKSRHYKNRTIIRTKK